MKKKVYVGFSGGVDSSVSAYLLKKKYDVTAVMFVNIDNQDESILKAKEVAQMIGVDFKTVDLQKEFTELVVNPFLTDYKSGNTPNPCINCNIYFKFQKFAQWCIEHGADYIATGHYCQTKGGRLYRGKDIKKDQSYFLHGITENILRKTIFPVGNLTKEKVRSIAYRIGLPNSSKKDSQEVCFINTSINEYLNNNLTRTPGDIVDIDSNEIIGKHDGIHSLTLGQRKGIQIGGSDLPYFVAKKDISKNIIYVAKGKMNPALWRESFELEDIHIINSKNKNIRDNLTAKVRYSAKDTPCNIDWDSNTVILSNPVWTPSIGQSLVIYRKNECIGGGKIVNIRQ